MVKNANQLKDSLLSKEKEIIDLNDKIFEIDKKNKTIEKPKGIKPFIGKKTPNYKDCVDMQILVENCKLGLLHENYLSSFENMNKDAPAEKIK